MNGPDKQATESTYDNATAEEQSADEGLYAKHQKVYPREVHGLFATLRVTGVFVLMGTYYLAPWFSWDGHQAVLFDLPARKFYILGLTFWPQDFIYLTSLLILAALSLFFFTAMAGRLWCGYACPQTVWTEVFLWIERKVEGSRLQQKKRDEAPWSAEKVRIKASKHFLWLALALWTGFTFVGYFTPIRELGSRFVMMEAGPWENFWILFYGFATYGNAGWLREQVCTYMCPYARFQSAMFDKDTLIISYDRDRGESRGSRKRGEDYRARQLGDCIDCTMCVQVCPTGIDIRDGLQYECIGCAACIDACDDVMERMGYEPGLVRYTTENRLAGNPARFLRPRIIIYTLILASVATLVLYGLLTRAPYGLDVIRDRNTLYRETDEGLIENVYTVKILNKDKNSHRFELTASGINGLVMATDEPAWVVESGEVAEAYVRLRVDPADLERQSSEVMFRLLVSDDPEFSMEEPARFLGRTIR